jgi:hypothetical protein
MQSQHLPAHPQASHGIPKLLSALLVVAPLLAACGGGSAATEGAKAAEPGASAAAAPSTSPPEASPSAGATTTTVALAGGGDLQGAKLSETHTVAATSASAAPAGSAAPAAHKAEPGRGPADIRAIVMAHRDEARACYDKALPSHPGIEGDLVVQWTIDPKGNVTQVSLDSSRSAISEPSVVACVAAVIQKIQFAPSPGGYETKAFYPFNFRIHHGQKATTP